MLCVCCSITQAQEKASAELLSTGYVFTEGPVWCGDYMLFSDIRGNAIHKWSEAGGAQLFSEPSDFTNGNTTNDNENFFVCRYVTRDIGKMNTKGEITPYVTHYQGKRFNSPNDIIISEQGSLYFVDPEFGLVYLKGDKQLDCHGLFYVAKGSTEAILVDELVRPNGLALSPDQSLLYLCETEGNVLYTYKLDAEGRASDREVFCRIEGAGSLDGMSCHKSGYLFVALGDGGMAVVSPEGEQLEIVEFEHGESVRNMCFDEQDNMYITAGTSLYKYNYDMSKLK